MPEVGHHENRSFVDQDGNFNVNGSSIITTSSDLVGWFGKTPIAQPADADQAALTDSTGATPDGTIEDVGTAVTGVDGTGNNAASKADVDSRLSGINENFAEVHKLLDAQRTALVNLGVMKGSA